MLHRLRAERGASAVEFALVLPLLVMLVLGIFEFGLAYNTKITLTHAAREGARAQATGHDGIAATKDAAGDLDASQITVTTTPCTAGNPTTVTASYDFAFDFAIVHAGTVTLSSKGVMRCGG
jgi:Flp pilus assembly protein TadG